MSDASENTTNEALKSAVPGLCYEEMKVDSSHYFLPFDGYGNGIIKIVDSENGGEIMAVAEIVDGNTILVGRKPS